MCVVSGMTLARLAASGVALGLHRADVFPCVCARQRLSVGLVVVLASRTQKIKQ